MVHICVRSMLTLLLTSIIIHKFCCYSHTLRAVSSNCYVTSFAQYTCSCITAGAVSYIHKEVSLCCVIAQFVCTQDYSKSLGQSFAKFLQGIGLGTSSKFLGFVIILIQVFLTLSVVLLDKTAASRGLWDL